MRVLVTGGYGFIGSHVLRQLVEQGHDVACFDISTPSPVAAAVTDETIDIRGDITDPVDVYDAVASFEPDRIIHLAALLGRPSQRHPRRAFEVNVNGSLTVFEAALSLGVDRVVAASSVSAYGVVTGVDRLDESVPRQPTNIYGLTKYVVERLGSRFQEDGIEFAAIQPSHGLGPDRLRGNVEDAFVVKAAVSGATLSVPRVDDPYEVIYVGDEASAFVAAALADTVPHDTYIIGTGELVTLEDIVDLVSEHVPDAELEIGDSRGDDELEPRPPTDTSRIRDDLGWAPTKSVSETVQTYVEWLRSNPDKWSFDPADAPWVEA